MNWLQKVQKNNLLFPLDESNGLFVWYSTSINRWEYAQRLSAMSQTIACLRKIETCFQLPQTLKASRLNEMKVVTHHTINLCASALQV